MAKSLSEQEALEKIREIFRENPSLYGQVSPNVDVPIVHEISTMPADQAWEKAQNYIADAKAHNSKAAQTAESAQQYQEKLDKHPITNAGRRNLIGFFTRQFLAAVNGTPFRRLDWLEVDSGGLHIYQPFSNVSQRTIKQRDLAEGTLVLSVNPPSYLDGIIGFLSQVSRRKVPIYIGEIVAYEPGSGNQVGSAVAWRPDKKLDEIKAALKVLHVAEHPYAGFRRVPRIEDFFAYYDPYPGEEAPTSQPQSTNPGSIDNIVRNATHDIIASTGQRDERIIQELQKVSQNFKEAVEAMVQANQGYSVSGATDGVATSRNQNDGNGNNSDNGNTNGNSDSGDDGNGRDPGQIEPQG